MRIKTIAGWLMVGAFAFAAPTFAHEGAKCPVPAKKAVFVKGGKTLALKLSGLHCAGCATGVENKLLKVPGVAGATVNPAKQTATVTIRKGAKRPADAALKAAVKAAGFVCVAVK
ncbi:MAG: heavy-metal-associated domain-containing protein [Armatimonadetes bacterium]|nr:heavy-metal-associated domain-containing protein [Armatimonadota bacterium]